METVTPKPAQRIAEEKAVASIHAGAVTIDSEGRLWRVWRYRHKKIVMLKEPKRIGSPGKDGYWRVGFGGGPVYVHRLVYLVLIGPIPDDKEVNHKDGDKSNCRPDNLELMTHKQNLIHASEVLGHFWGNQNGNQYRKPAAR